MLLVQSGVVVANTPSVSSLLEAYDVSTTVIFILITCYLIAYILVIVAWYRDKDEPDCPSNSHFYPVSLRKNLVLSTVTLGWYPAYWSYRQWDYIKQRDGLNIMPFWRAFFYWLWFIPLWNALRGEKEFSPHFKLLRWPLAIILFVLCCLLQVFSYVDHYYLITPIGITLTMWPMIYVINSANVYRLQTLAFNNRWLLRHWVLILLFIPLLMIGVGQWSYYLPSGTVIEGDLLWSKDIAFMRRVNAISDGETPRYFYSDSRFDYWQDGNGFTGTEVFSYWRNSQKVTIVNRRLFTNVAAIKYGESIGSYLQVIVIVDNDNDEFNLYIDREGAPAFFRSLTTQWKKIKNTGTQ